MKPNFKSYSFILALVFIAAFLLQLFICGILIRNAIADDGNYSTLMSIAWSAVLWIGLAGVFIYRSASVKHTRLGYFLSFIITPLALSPILVIFFAVFILFPIYSLVNEAGFK